MLQLLLSFFFLFFKYVIFLFQGLSTCSFLCLMPRLSNDRLHTVQTSAKMSSLQRGLLWPPYLMSVTPLASRCCLISYFIPSFPLSLPLSLLLFLYFLTPWVKNIKSIIYLSSWYPIITFLSWIFLSFIPIFHFCSLPFYICICYKALNIYPSI